MQSNAETRPATLTGEKNLGVAADVSATGAAREMNDREYFASCLDRSGETDTSLLEQLPALCLTAREEATSYTDWQIRTREAALNLHATLGSR